MPDVINALAAEAADAIAPSGELERAISRPTNGRATNRTPGWRA